MRRAAQAFGSRGQSSGKSVPLSQPSRRYTKGESAECRQREDCKREDTGGRGPGFLEQAINRLEELQPFDKEKIAEAVEWLQRLKAWPVTADSLKENAIGKRLRAIAKSGQSGLASQANEVVAEWKAQLLRA